jgi:hypothetical protein
MKREMQNTQANNSEIEAWTDGSLVGLGTEIVRSGAGVVIQHSVQH